MRLICGERSNLVELMVFFLDSHMMLYSLGMVLMPYQFCVLQFHFLLICDKLTDLLKSPKKIIKAHRIMINI